MLRINPDFRTTKTNTSEPYKKNQNFKGDVPQTASETTMQTVTPDFSVKTPIANQKVSGIKLPFDTNASLYKLANGQRVVIIP